jgi:hypothetical protein
MAERWAKAVLIRFKLCPVSGSCHFARSLLSAYLLSSSYLRFFPSFFVALLSAFCVRVNTLSRQRSSGVLSVSYFSLLVYYERYIFLPLTKIIIVVAVVLAPAEFMAV